MPINQMVFEIILPEALMYLTKKDILALFFVLLALAVASMPV